MVEEPPIDLGKEIQKYKPTNLSEAARVALSGQYVDVLPFLKEDVNIQQIILDTISSITTSPEYNQYKAQIKEALKNVRGQTIFFDLERTLMEMRNGFSNKQPVYYTNPYLVPVIEELIANGNMVGIWTAAAGENLNNFRKSMPDSMQKLPTIDGRSWENILSIYKQLDERQMNEPQTVEQLFQIWPDITQQDVINGRTFFDKMKKNDDILWSGYMIGDDQIFMYRKYPQFVVSPERGIFVDDYDEVIEGLKESGWPAKRAITFPKEIKHFDFSWTSMTDLITGGKESQVLNKNRWLKQAKSVTSSLQNIVEKN